MHMDFKERFAELTRIGQIVGQLRFRSYTDLGGVITGKVPPTDKPAVLDVESSFLKPVPKNESLDDLRADPEGSENVE
jgi:hypothetical protein